MSVAVAEEAPPDLARAGRQARGHWWTAAPAAALFVVGFAGPLTVLLLTSVGYSADNHSVSFDAYRAMLSDPSMLGTLARTLETSLAVVVISAVVGYPVALYFISSSGWKQTALAIVIIGSLLVNSVVRVFGWLILFVPNGFVSRHFHVELLYTQTATVIGLVQLFMPFMIISLITSLGSIDPALMRAGSSLGAGTGRLMLRIVMPLSLPGLVSGCIIVFGAATGSVVTPLLLGGTQVQLVTSEVYRRSFVTFDPTGAASLAAALLIINVVLITMVQAGNRRLERRLQTMPESS